MITYIALLRGINVGGHKKVPMAELREVLMNSGFKEVKTYIQSGNVIFGSEIEDQGEIETIVKTSILAHFGFDVSVLVRTREQLLKIFDDCPFPEDIKMNSYFAILSKVPNDKLIKEASEKTYENEDYHILNDCLYLYCSQGYGKAKFNLNYFEKKLGVNATSRNYKSMVKLLAMSAEN